MIKKIRHKGLKRLFLHGESSGVPPQQMLKLDALLVRLGAATSEKDMNFPGSGLHPLKGDREGSWAVTVTGNWRLTFRFEDGDATDVR